MPTLNWIGKDKIINHHQEVPYKVLEHKFGVIDGKETSAETKSGNLIIHGDNLEALKSLLPKYQGKVSCIYIDPPYNTGEEAWEYNDNVNDSRIKEWLGVAVGQEGEDLTRHDKWLCMMYPRLVLLNKLLENTGIIFISIDDNELANLRLLCNEIFGSQNFVATFIWEKRKNRENRKVVSYRHDYILCYCKCKKDSERCLKLLPMSAEALSRYQNPDNDPRGLWKSDPATAQAGHATNSQFYTLVAPNGKKHTLPNGRCWLYTEDVMNQAIQEGRIWFGESGNNVPRKKTYLLEKDRGLTPETILFADDVSTNEGAKNHLKSIFSEQLPFTTPKPVELIEHLLQLASDKDSIILDSFAGSGTTAHAVLNLNKDGGNRKFILIEMEDYADSVTAERVKRVMSGYGEDKKAVNGTGGEFDYYELGKQLFLEDGNVNEDVDEKLIREYIFFSETNNIPIEDQRESNKFFLGEVFNTAYYFYYEKGRKTTLTHETLRQIVKKKAEQYIIYADTCTLTEDEMNNLNVIFKKTPRDIKRF